MFCFLPLKPQKVKPEDDYECKYKTLKESQQLISMNIITAADYAYFSQQAAVAATPKINSAVRHRNQISQSSIKQDHVWWVHWTCVTKAKPLWQTEAIEVLRE